MRVLQSPRDWGKGEGLQLIYRKKRHVVFKVLTGYVDERESSKMGREGLLGYCSVTSVCLILLSGKKMQSSRGGGIHSLGKGEYLCFG